VPSTVLLSLFPDRSLRDSSGSHRTPVAAGERLRRPLTDRWNTCLQVVAMLAMIATPPK
jgi:hypothetical protein